MVGIMDALSDEFYKMGTFSDDYFKNVIMPYKEGVTSKPGFLQSMKNWQPWRAFMPQSMGGTYYTKPTPMASNFLRGAAKIGSRSLGPFSLLMSSPLNAGEDEAMARINEQWSQQQNQNRGNVQAPAMTSSQIRQEADRTGGTRHAGEMTKAAGQVRTQPVQGPHGNGGGQGGGQAAGQRPSRTSRPSGYAAVRKYGRYRGGIASL